MDAISKAIEALEGVADMITASDADAYKEVLDVIAALQAEQARQGGITIESLDYQILFNAIGHSVTRNETSIGISVIKFREYITAAKEQSPQK